MKNRTKKLFKITGITLGALIVFLSAVIAFSINFIFTPEKLTPIVLNVANQNINAKLDMNSVELTFFSTFPRFGIKLENGTLVSKAIRDSLWQRTDTLATFRKAVAVINLIDYLQQKKISINRLSLDSTNIYAFKGKDGIANWNILIADTTNIPDTATATSPIINEIDIKHVSLRHTTVTFDDREMNVFANLWDANLKLKANLKKEQSTLTLDFNNKNILFWQNGELLAHRIATHLQTDIELNRSNRALSLHDAMMEINGIKLDIHGSICKDTTAQALDIDLQYGLHAPSLETVLHMIPESILKKEKVSAKGDVTVNGNLKGLYGKGKMPLATLKIEINDASAQYAQLPYGIDELKANFFGQIDLMRQSPSYLDLKIFHFKGAHTDILADAKVNDLLGDPDISFHTQSTIDLTALAQTFPLQDGVSIEGKLDADMNVRCRLSSIKKKNIGRIRAKGKINMSKLALRDKNKKFEFTSDASLSFVGNDVLGAHIEIGNMAFHSTRLNSSINNLSALIKTTNPQDTTRIALVECKLNANKLKASLPDTSNLFCGKTVATVKLQPTENNPTRQINQLKATIGDAKIIDTSKLKADTVQILSRVELKNVKTGMKMAYTIVSETEANLKQGKISVNTPIAQGLLGKKVGDIAEITIPQGKISLEVTGISF